MRLTKDHWVWTVTLVVTVVLCAVILIVHFKNWISTDNESLKLRSGFYYVEIPYHDLDSVVLVDRMPPMERLNGFSALEKEKGIFREFKDSLNDKKVYVFVDNVSQQKVKLVYKDSVCVYVNLKDSVETIQLLNNLSAKINSLRVSN